MKLVKFRIVGHPRHNDTKWRDVGRGLTLLDFGNQALAADILLALQSLSPPYDIDTVQPFQYFPQYMTKGRTTKKIIPAKKTAAFVVVSKTLPLVRQLGALDPILYELDRIELGRRRDLSLWSNFVEIASSSRWSDLRPVVEKLLPTAPNWQVNSALSRLSEYCAAFRDTDRIKGEVARELASRLAALESNMDPGHHELVEQALYFVQRHDRFQEAKNIMLQQLPLFLLLSGQHLRQHFFEVKGRAGPSVTNGMTDPLGFLLTELYKDNPPEDSLQCFTDRVNTAINDHLPDQEALPFFVLEKNHLHLKLATASQVSELRSLTPIHRFIVIVQTAIALHLLLKHIHPIIFLHPHGLAKTAEENNSLLNILSQMFSKSQALLAPGSELMTAYREGGSGKRLRSLALD